MLRGYLRESVTLELWGVVRLKDPNIIPLNRYVQPGHEKEEPKKLAGAHFMYDG